MVWIPLKNEIGLSPEQEQKLNELYKVMNIRAIELGELLGRLAKIHGELRSTHLAAHLKTPEIVSAEQIKEYNRLRGYSVGAIHVKTFPTVMTRQSGGSITVVNDLL